MIRKVGGAFGRDFSYFCRSRPKAPPTRFYLCKRATLFPCLVMNRLSCKTRKNERGITITWNWDVFFIGHKKRVD